MFSANGSQVSSAANYIEDVFSTYLYTGTGASLTITNGIDLSTKGGLVWCKARASAYDNSLYDTARGINKELYSNTTGAQYPGTGTLTSFNTDGFTLGSNSSANSGTSVSWTFRKQPKFFDVVTWTGDGTGARTISHSLGSAPGCMFVKRTDTTQDWSVYHQALTTPATDELYLNRAYAANTGVSTWNSSAPTSTSFSVDSTRNANGGTFVAYIFAHNAGGFGLNGTDNVITCGTFTSGSSDTFVSLGYEPQFVLWKNKGTEDWRMFDNMRGVPTGGNTAQLKPNASSAEDSSFQFIDFNSTGFTYKIAGGNPSQTYIYIAIRRGPMKVPTDGTKVFKPLTWTGTGGTAAQTGVGFSPDLLIDPNRGQGNYASVFDKLRGVNNYLLTQTTDTENGGGLTLGTFISSFDQDGVTFGSSTNSGLANYSSWTYVNYYFKRAPSFFDEVCYTGNGAGTYNINHNLGVTPEMLIIKDRSVGDRWSVYFPAFDTFMTLNAINGKQNGSPLPSAVTSTTFNVGNTTGYASVSGRENTSGATYVSYLFATCAGVSKVFNYTGNGSSQTINCGFTAGARFILIKRTDSTGDWYVWDTARGIVSGNDPHLSLNTTAAEVTTDDTIDPDSTGFIVNQLSATNVNVSSATYIGIAIA